MDQAEAGRVQARHGGVAVFDFDCTLTRVDSLLPWLKELGGPWRVALALMPSCWAFLATWGRGWGARRTAFKDAMLVHLTRGRSVTSAQAAAERLARHLRWRENQLSRFAEHRDRGDYVIIATGSPRLVVEVLTAERCRPDLLIGTELEVNEDQRLTGRMLGGNCVREEKARRVAALLARQGPFRESHGYGNLPHDRLMLELMDHAVVV
ncbi:MAG: HAD-IB family hydrolase [Rhodospirillaceae bacterium]|nr:HAD-IB family hydrolase [Rhodospirillaceae bacterium]